MGLLDRWFGNPSRDKYAKMFMQALRDAGDQRAMHYDREEFVLKCGGDGAGVAFLWNFYADYCAAPRGDRSQLLKMQVRGALSHLKEMPEEFDDAKCDIYPKVWPRAALENTRLRQRVSGEKALDIPTQIIGEHLELSLCYDLPEAVRTISQSDLDNWGVSYYEAMEIARQNLETTNFAFAAIGESLYASATGDTYDATRLLLLDLIRKLDVQGEHIAMVPNRDSLLITGSEDEQGLGMMLAFAEKILNDEPRPMVGTPLHLEGDEWVEWLPAPEHPLYNDFRNMELQFVGPLYDEQKELLDEIHEIELTDSFVASFSAMENKQTEQLVSFAVWGDGVDTLLPKTHKVFFVREKDNIPAVGPWEKVEEVVGHLMQRTDQYPARYQVREFPTDEELAAIGREEF